MIALPALTEVANSESSGYFAVTSIRLLLCQRVRPPSTNASVRYPSHLISYAQLSSSVGSVPIPAFIGSTG